MSHTPLGWTGRTLLGVTTLGVALAVSITVPGAQPGGRAVRITATTARSTMDWDRRVDSLKSSGALRVSSTRPDLLLPGRTHERLDQYVNGVRIYGAQTVRQLSADGEALSLFGTVHADLAIDTTPTIDAAAAAARAAALTGGTVLAKRVPELVVLPLAGLRGDGEPRGEGYALAWILHVRIPGDVVMLFLDAHTGAELARRSDIRRDARVGVGTGVLGDQKKLSVDARAGAFFADDGLRPPTLITLDMRGDLDRAKAILNGVIDPVQGDIAMDTDNVWDTNPASVDAHAYLGMTYDYYLARFGRRGLDNRNGPIVALTHPVTRPRIKFFLDDEETLGMFYLNAFWCGACGPEGVGMMVFGDGAPAGVFDFAVNYFAGALDIVGHELTHAVTEYSSNLIYQGESGALNEAFSDMMGASVEAYFQPAGNGPLRADWLVGEDIMPRRAGFMRSFANPLEFGDPDHYTRRYVGPADNGGVHTNSGIANHAFYLAIEGGTNQTSGRVVTGVGAANRDQIEKVFYRAFTQLLPPDATFSVARQATLQSAADLYGPASSTFRAVAQAWDAVGVP